MLVPTKYVASFVSELGEDLHSLPCQLHQVTASLTVQLSHETLIRVWFDPQQHKSAQLDRVTSKAIRYKGVVSASKETLDWIDPWLVERNVGVTNLLF